MMIKPVDIAGDLLVVVLIGGYNWFMTTIVAPSYDWSKSMEVITAVVSAGTGILLMIYTILRCRKMYWDGIISKNQAKTPPVQDKNNVTSDKL